MNLWPLAPHLLIAVLLVADVLGRSFVLGPFRQAIQVAATEGP